MKTVLILRPNSTKKANGIDSYCFAIEKMFQNDSEFRILPIKNYPSKRSNILHGVYNYSVFFDMIKHSDADIIHINGYASYQVYQAFKAAVKCNKKIVYTAHWHPFSMLNHPLRGKLFFYIFLEPYIRRFANTIITLNNEDTAYFNKLSKQVVKIPHWINYSEKADIKMNANKIHNMILFVGRFNSANKGLDHILNLPEKEFDIHLVGSGVPPLRKDISVHQNISDEELNLLYKKASVVVVPSKYEAFSYVTLEALSVGTPVVISDRVRIADYIKNFNGVYIFPYGDNIQFKEKIKQAIGSKVDRDAIIKFFDIQRIKGLYKEVYKNC